MGRLVLVVGAKVGEGEMRSDETKQQPQ